MRKSIKRIAIAGSGNIAWHLANGLKLQGFKVSGIWSRNYLHALALAESCTAMVYKDITDLRIDTDLIIIAVADNAIEPVAQSLGLYDGIVVHTAGSVAMDVLHGSFEKHGVFYPLQTFSKETPVDLREVPFFLESSSDEVLEALKQVALTLSNIVYEADSRQRMLLHVAAVFASNYSNLMYAIGNDILKSSNIPHEVLHSLIMETAQKAVSSDPISMQTGPARRKDTLTIDKHIEILASLPEYSELYRRLANLISAKY